MAFILNNQTQHTKILTLDMILSDAKDKNIALMPFDIYAYVNTFDNIKIIDDYLSLEISGMIEYIGDGFIITINKNHSEGRRRFTLAHEFAHYSLHKEYLKSNKIIKEKSTLFITTEFRKNLKELEANEFAINILLPKEEFINVIKSGKTKLRDIAEYFCVSATAVKYRAYELDLIKDY